MLKKEDILAVGLDLDGTLYQRTSQIDSRVRYKIAEKILEQHPNLETVVNAYRHFNERYVLLKGGSRVLEEVGFKNPRKIMNWCLANADILDLISHDEKLVRILKKIKQNHFVYLLTSSPEELSLEKLARIGISPAIFNTKIYGDTPEADSKSKGTAFDLLLRKVPYIPKHHVFIGDSIISDIFPAKERGMQTISVYNNTEEADANVNHIYEIEALLL